MCSFTFVCAAAVESVTLPKLAGLGPIIPGVAYKTGTAETTFDFDVKQLVLMLQLAKTPSSRRRAISACTA